LVYSMTIEKHGKHFEYFLNKFQQNKFFANRAKNVFTQKEMDFLGHILLKEGVRHNSKKLEVIQD